MLKDLSPVRLPIPPPKQLIKRLAQRKTKLKTPQPKVFSSNKKHRKTSACVMILAGKGFDKENGSAGGNGSCNSFGSSTIINGKEVSFKNVFSTKMYCEQVQSIENRFLGSLGKITRYETIDNTLFLYHDK